MNINPISNNNNISRQANLPSFKGAKIISIPKGNLNFRRFEISDFGIENIFQWNLNCVTGEKDRGLARSLTDTLGLTKDERKAFSFWERPFHNKLEVHMGNIERGLSFPLTDSYSAWFKNGKEWIENHIQVLTQKDLTLPAPKFEGFESFLVLTKEHLGAYLETQTPIAIWKNRRLVTAEMKPILKKYGKSIDDNKGTLIKLLLTQKIAEENLMNILKNEKIDEVQIKKLDKLDDLAAAFKKGVDY